MNAASPEDHKACDCNKPGCDCSMPQVTFSTFILSLASSALVQLGEVPNPESGATEQDLVIAKHTIDILTMLEEKTKQCLDSDEARLLEGILYELRMKYVMKKVDYKPCHKKRSGWALSGSPATPEWSWRAC